MENRKILSKISKSTLLIAFLCLVGCATISKFDQYVYAQTISVKVDAINLMDLAATDFTVNLPTINYLKLNIQKVYEYEKNRPKNEITVQLWDKLMDPQGHLLGGFLVRWEKEKKLNPTFIVEAKKLVDKAFDQIVQLESKKIKPSDIKP